uniref:Uncharacterized protein n=1 Tax=Solanum lycopersicum TaxID=4081 RepID=A0A494G906_SOLLC
MPIYTIYRGNSSPCLIQRPPRSHTGLLPYHLVMRVDKHPRWLSVRYSRLDWTGESRHHIRQARELGIPPTPVVLVDIDSQGDIVSLGAVWTIPVVSVVLHPVDHYMRHAIRITSASRASFVAQSVGYRGRVGLRGVLPSWRFLHFVRGLLLECIGQNVFIDVQPIAKFVELSLGESAVWASGRRPLVGDHRVEVVALHRGKRLGRHVSGQEDLQGGKHADPDFEVRGLGPGPSWSTGDTDALHQVCPVEELRRPLSFRPLFSQRRTDSSPLRDGRLGGNTSPCRASTAKPSTSSDDDRSTVAMEWASSCQPRRCNTEQTSQLSAPPLTTEAGAMTHLVVQNHSFDPGVQHKHANSRQKDLHHQRPEPVPLAVDDTAETVVMPELHRGPVERPHTEELSHAKRTVSRYRSAFGWLHRHFMSHRATTSAYQHGSLYTCVLYAGQLSQNVRESLRGALCSSFHSETFVRRYKKIIYAQHSSFQSSMSSKTCSPPTSSDLQLVSSRTSLIRFPAPALPDNHRLHCRRSICPRAIPPRARRPLSSHKGEISRKSRMRGRSIRRCARRWLS